MKIFALIKKNYKNQVVTDEDIRETVNHYININIKNYLDNLDADERLTLDTLDYLYYSNCMFSNYTANKILKKLMKIKREYEIKKVLIKALEPYDIDEHIIDYILKEPNFNDCFYTDPKGKVRVNDYMLKDLFIKCFGRQEEILQSLVDTVNSTDFSLEYYCHEIRDYFATKEFKVAIDQSNFETFLRELGEIGNPRIKPTEKHSCYDCASLSPIECEKAEYIKKPISDYSFIESGYQIFSVNDAGKWNMVTFCVTHCHDYTYVRNTPDKGSKAKKKK